MVNGKLSLLLLSTSTIYGSSYLDYCQDQIKEHFNGSREIVFIPYASPSGISYDNYSELAAKKFNAIGLELKGIHTFPNAQLAIENADGIFIGGGNTFLLLLELYKNGLVEVIRKRVNEGMPYMGTSAGSNVAGKTISTTNDMPIIHTPTFDALDLVHINLNPHYLDPDPNSRHKGETRETRIKEFHAINNIPVLGLREGSWIEVTGHKIKLGGNLDARVFEQGEEPMEYKSGSDLSFLQNNTI